MNASETQDPGAYLPLKPDVFLILAILARDDQYGYGIMKAAEGHPDGGMRLQAGALYRRLKWMLDEGLIRELAPEEEPAHREKERRRYYRVTKLGRRVAKAEARRMEGLVSTARKAHLLGEEPATEGGG